MHLSKLELAWILRWCKDSDTLRGGGDPKNYDQTSDELRLRDKIQGEIDARG